MITIPRVLSSFSSWSILLVLVASLVFHRRDVSLTYAKELEVTKEWQAVGENDTVPVGVHVRMDLSTGEKWVKLVDDDDEEDDEEAETTTVNVTMDGSSSVAVSVTAVVNEDGIIQQFPQEIDSSSSSSSFDFDMMHRTLSKLPDEEKERMGGLPELPQAAGAVVTAQQRKAFEERMLGIWTRRQKELAHLQEQLLDFPLILKERIKSIDEYLKDPQQALKEVNLEAELPQGIVTHIVSVLDDLQFQLSDVDMARDFHTMGGWPLLALLVSDDSHVPVNKTVQSLSRTTEAKILTIQALAAEAMGTAVKNTEEFFPFPVERIVLVGGTTTTTAIDILIDLFCQKNYQDTWERRTLLSKGIYSIGAMLRGNRLAQTHVLQQGRFGQLGEKYKILSSSLDFSSANTKLLLRLSSLVSDIVEDVLLHPELSDIAVNQQIIEAVTTVDWCDATCLALTSEAFLPVKVQESLLHAMSVLSPYCRWTCGLDKMQTSIARMKTEWQSAKDTLDEEHLQQMLDLARDASNALDEAASSKPDTSSRR